MNSKDFKVNNIKVIGGGHDSVAYLINNEYIFKKKFNTNNKKICQRKKAIYYFLNQNLDINVMIPNIEYSYIRDKVSILSYKQINGKFLTTFKRFLPFTKINIIRLKLGKILTIT